MESPPAAAPPAELDLHQNRPGVWRRVGSLCLDFLGIAGWTWLAIEVPLPVINEYLTVKNAIVAFIAVIAIGRTIVDTIYDRES